MSQRTAQDAKRRDHPVQRSAIPKCTTNNVAGSAVFLSPVGQLDKAIKGNIQCDVYGIVQDQNVCVHGLVVTLLLKLLAVHLCP